MIDLFDRVIRVEFIKVGTTIPCMVIDSERDPIKPAINVIMHMLPGNHVHQCKVELKNMIVRRTLDLRSIKMLRITLGYRSTQRNTYECPVFSSYQTGPAPNGLTVFNCLTVGSAIDDLTAESSYRIEFRYAARPDTAAQNIVGVLSTVFKDLNLTYDVKGLTANFLDRAVWMNKVFESSTKLGMIDRVQEWLNGELEAYNNWQKMVYRSTPAERRPASPPVPITVSIMIENNVVHIIGNVVGTAKDSTRTTERGVNITHIRSASFTGPILTLITPYNPLVKPGTLIEINTDYYTGDMLPNVLDISRTLKAGTFRVITANFQFSTTTGENTMTLLAQPAMTVLSDEDQEAAKTSMTTVVEEANKLAKSKVVTVSTRYGYFEEENGALQGEFADVWRLKMDFPDTKIYTIVAGDTLAKIAKREWNPLGTDILYAREVDTLHALVPGPIIPDIPLQFFFPIIMLATYKQAMKDNGLKWNYQSKNDAGLRRMGHPDCLIPGCDLVIPNLTKDTIFSWMGKYDPQKLFELMADYYKAVPGDSAHNYFYSISFYLQFGEKAQ